MLSHIFSTSAVIVAVLFIRAIFRGRMPNRLIYALWAAVFIRLVVPGTLFDVEITIPDRYVQTDSYDYQSQTDTEDDRLTSDLPLYEDTQSNSLPAQTPEDAYLHEESALNTADKTSSTGISLASVIRYVYILGVFVVLCWFVSSDITVYRLLRKTRVFLRKDGYVSIYVSDTAVSPCTYGILPTIYLTSRLADLPEAELVVSHEKMHLNQLDNYRKPLRRLLLSIYWYNPLVWIYVILAERDAELACDEAVVSSLDEKGRLEYARMIFDYAPRAKISVASFGGKPMKKRISEITKKRSFNRTTTILALLLTAAFCLLGFVGCTGSAETVDESVSASQSIDNDDSSVKNERTWKEKLQNPDLPSPEEYVGKEITYAENGMPVFPSLEYRTNSDYVRSCAGGIDFTYDELVSMSQDEIAYFMLAPTTRKNHFDINPMLGTALQVDFNDENGNTCIAYEVDESLFDTYESFVQEIRTYFSEDIAAKLFSEGEYFEYGNTFYTTMMPKSEAVYLFHSIDYEIVSASETEIVYRGTAKYFVDEEEYKVYMSNTSMTFPEASFEIREYKYVLSIQDDGRWVFTEFEF